MLTFKFLNKFLHTLPGSRNAARKVSFPSFIISERIVVGTFRFTWHNIQEACTRVTFLKIERAVSERDPKCVVHPVKLVSATSITLKAFC